MDKFLEIVFTNYAENNKEVRDAFQKQFEPLLLRIREQVSEKIYFELEEMLSDCAVDSSMFYAVEGMKLALNVMNGSYVPAI